MDSTCNLCTVQADSGSVMLLHVFFWRSQRLLMKLASVLTVATHTNPVPDHLQHFMVAKFPGGDGLFHHNPADPSPSCTFVTTLIPRITQMQLNLPKLCRPNTIDSKQKPGKAKWKFNKWLINYYYIMARSALHRCQVSLLLIFLKNLLALKLRTSKIFYIPSALKKICLFFRENRDF